MDSEDDVRAFLTGAAGGPTPPMRLEAADVIERGGRVRRRRKRFAVAGTSAATAVVLAVAGFLAGHRAGPPEPLEPAGPVLSTIGTSAPSVPPSPEVAPPTSIAPPAAEPSHTPSRATRVPQPPSAGRSTPRSIPVTTRPSSGPTETDVPSATTTR